MFVCLLFMGGCAVQAPSFPAKVIHNDTTLIVENYAYSVAAGEVNSGTVWNKFGYNDDIDTATSPEIIASWGGSADFFLSSAEILNISSTDADDTSGGTGAHSIIIYGVDNTWADIIDVVTLNGTSTVQSNLAFLGINRMAIYQSGSSPANEGDITAIGASAGTTQGQIPTGTGTSEQSFLFVAANHTFLASDLVINANKLGSGSAPKITIYGYSQVPLTNSRYEVFRKTIDTSVENSFVYKPTMPFVITEKQILYFTATSDTNNGLVNLRFSGITKE